MDRMLALVTSGELGEVQYVEARMLMPAPAASDPRWRAELAGGSLMDVGCYAVQALRDVAAALGGSPQVVGARAGEADQQPGVDAWLAAELGLPGGVPAHLESSMVHHRFESSLRLVGSRGEACAPDFTKPHADDRVIVSIGGEQREERCGTRSTYVGMLEAFSRLVREGGSMRTDAEHAVAGMKLIDDLYAAAGMPPRLRSGDVP